MREIRDLLVEIGKLGCLIGAGIYMIEFTYNRHLDAGLMAVLMLQIGLANGNGK